MKLGWIGFVGAVVFLVSIVPSSVRADVHDNAKIFGQPAVDSANRAMQKMERVHNKQLVIETFAAISDDQKAAEAANSDEFFKQWMGSRAQELKVNGVYVLICMDPHHLEVGAGKNTIERGDFTDEDKTRLYQLIKSDLHDKNYDKALGDAVDDVERAYTANISSPNGRSSVGGGETQYYNHNYHNTGTTTGTGFGLGGLICFGVAAVIIISLIKSIFRGNSGGGYGGGVNYPQGGQSYGQNYGGGGGFGNMGGGGGSGFGRGFLGGLLGGALGGYAADRFDHRNDQSNAGFPQNDNSGNFGGGGGGGSFDSGPSDAGQGFGSSGIGGDFSSGGGGGDSGGGGGSSGGDF